jgi:hypothetical protein
MKHLLTTVVYHSADKKFARQKIMFQNTNLLAVPLKFKLPKISFQPGTLLVQLRLIIYSKLAIVDADPLILSL